VRSAPPQQQPQYRPAPTNNPPVARYPRPESTDAPKKKVASAPAPAPKKKVEVASTKSTKGSATAKSTKVDPKATVASKTTGSKKPGTTKPVVASSSTTRKKESVSDKATKAKETIAEAKTVVKSVKEEAKKNLGELARDLHAPATNSTSQKPTVAAVTPKEAQLKSADAALLAPPPTNISSPVPTITVNANATENARLAASVNVPSVITQAENLPSHVISSGMMPLAMPPSAPITPPTPSVASSSTESLKEAVTAPPKAHTLSPLPIEEFPADDDDTARASKLLANSGGSTSPAEKPKVTVKEPEKPAVMETPKEPVQVVKAVAETPAAPPTIAKTVEEPVTPAAKPTLTLPPMVKPSMNSVRTASFKPNAPATSAPAIDSGSDFTPGGANFDEPPKPKATPSVTLSPSLGTMTIDAERADSENSKNLVTFNGNVRIDCKRFQMKADKVVSHLRQPDAGGGVEKVVSDGNVTVKMLGTDGPGYVASGSHAIYDPIKETILLTGWPKIEEGNKALVASSASTEILIDTKTSRLTTNGSTKTVIRQ
jgi:lipopolysaccharide transport protein LptA